MRRKLTLMVPQALMGMVDDVAKRSLGIGRNAFFCLGGVFLLAKLAPILPLKKRTAMVAELEMEWQKIVAELRKAA